MDGILIVNKPEGITSHTLVQKVRHILNTQKVGHTGTLDPLASGVMLLTVGKATKLLPYIVSHTKEYIAVIKLGVSTDTLDITGTVLKEKPVVSVDREQVISVLNGFLGKSMQVPPMYSAKKIDGHKMYEFARKGIEVERKPVEIEIFHIDLLGIYDDEIVFRTVCSSGTYVRVLCQQIAEKLDNEGCMKSLVRTAVDRYRIDYSCTVEDIEMGEYDVLSAYDVLKNYRYVEMDDLSAVYNGKPVKLDCDDDIVFITHEEKIIAAYKKDNDIYRCQRGLW
ncbi:MAG: tRNA pseudouridine(55) synthase TruB [Erysipelotrichaceae bacterium]|nr:tRNA pseudouridine(55) synthase TruB [Erysipelotrichaceae bacterium]